MVKAERTLSALAALAVAAAIGAQFMLASGNMDAVTFTSQSGQVNYIDSASYRRAQYLSLKITGAGASLLINGEPAPWEYEDGEYRVWLVFDGDIVELDARGSLNDVTVIVGGVGESVKNPKLGARFTASPGIFRLFTVSVGAPG